MKKLEHTPGPWDLIPYLGGPYRCSLHCDDSSPHMGDLYLPVYHPDARLIEAAPEMYELLRSIRPMVQTAPGMAARVNELLERLEGE